MSAFRIMAVLVVCGVIVLGGILYFQQKSETVKSSLHLSAAEEEAAYLEAQKLVSEGKFAEALEFFNKYDGQISIKTDFGHKWYDLLIDVFAKVGKYGQIINLYEGYPALFTGNELKSTMAAYGYILMKSPQNYWEIRKNWEGGNATLLDTWFLLDADALLLEGKKEEALELLQSRKLEGKSDVDRLMRLSIFYAAENPKAAWDYLSEAYVLNPQSVDVISYRGRLLESMGQKSLALYEYLNAIGIAKENLFLQDQLAEYYMRQSQVALALSVWLQTLSKPSLDTIWIKALFWLKVATPIPVNWGNAVLPKSSDRSFIEYLMSLPKDEFWNEAAFDKLPNQKNYLQSIQITFWLRLLEYLKKGSEGEAQRLLDSSVFSTESINPALEKALQQVVDFRKKGSLNDDLNRIKEPLAEDKPEIQKLETTPIAKETFFNEINLFVEDLAKTGHLSSSGKNMQTLLENKEIFSALFLASGWLEAALQLHVEQVLPDDFPDWIAYGIAQAYRVNRSTKEALDFALKQKKTPALSLLIAEFYMAENQGDKALVVIEPYEKDTSDIGYRASWLAYLIYSDKQQFAKAKEAIESNPKLMEDTLGKEGLARLALLGGDEKEAEMIYSQIQETSPEAISYLARKAYAEKDWEWAEKLTQKLVFMFPDNPLMRANLNVIVEEKKKAESAKKD